MIDKATSEDITRRLTRSERGKTLVDVVLQCGHPNCFSVFLECLREDNEWVYGQVTPCKAKMIYHMKTDGILALVLCMRLVKSTKTIYISGLQEHSTPTNENYLYTSNVIYIGILTN